MANGASGMAVHDDCKLKFLELKAKRTYRYLVFKIEEMQKQVVVEKLGEPTDSYELCDRRELPKRQNCFIAWFPDASMVRSKMIYASSKDRFKRELNGVQIELQATNSTEMAIDVI